MTFKDWCLKHDEKISESIQYVAEFAGRCIIVIFALTFFMQITARMLIDFAPQVCSLLKDSAVQEATSSFSIE